MGRLSEDSFPPAPGYCNSHVRRRRRSICLYAACHQYVQSARRKQDRPYRSRYLAKKLRDTYADLRRHVRDLPFKQSTPDIPNLEVAIFAWSWRNLAFMGYSYTYDKSGALRMNSLKTLEIDRPYPHFLMGDVASDARLRLAGIRKSRGLPVPKRGDPNAPKVAAEAFFDWEPLEVLVEMTEDRTVRSVGGVPQVIRIYQYGECEPFVWRTSVGKDYFGGRPVQASERFDRRILELSNDGVNISFSDRSVYFDGGTVD